MSRVKTGARLGAVVAAGLLSFGMAGPAHAAPGANGGCPGGTFCPTPSGTSGNGYGNAALHANPNGLPDSGTRGQADDKNPLGQSANDNNKGYECDDNGGVGQTNPAHTGCDTGSGGSGGY